jgi:prepilin-type processing-associated H-X9-DG protein
MKRTRFVASRAGEASRAFTIVEIMVVIGIIGLLMGILLPVLSSAQRQGRAMVCMNNMRQITVAHGVYMNLNNEHLVDAGMPHGGAGDLRSSWLFTLTKIDPGLTDAFRSPVDDSRFWSRKDGGSRDDAWTLREAMDLLASNPNATLTSSQIARWSSYGLNDQLTQYAPALPDPNASNGFRITNWRRLQRVPRPSRTIQFVMMTDGEHNASAASFAMADHVHVLDWDSPMAPAPALAANHMQLHAHGGQRGRWSSKSNYAFLDGHVATHEFEVVYQDGTTNNFIPDFAR